MNCYLCDNREFEVLLNYDCPDKYEKWMDISPVSRQWCKCTNCDFIQSTRNYDLSKIEKIYKDGYRFIGFRGEPINQTFDKIMALPFEKSENRQRCEWLKNHTGKGTILDIGSGLGVFPSVMQEIGYNVECVEENKDSIGFIKSIGFECYENIPDKEYDFVSLIHVLEHIPDPEQFLRRVKKNIRKKLFVEVPDVSEFDYLDKDHDEFNSCHVMFYSRDSLMDLLENSGYLVNEIVSKFYQDRQLSRIMALCS